MMLFSKIKSILLNPWIVVYRLKGYLYHLRYKSIDSTAIVISPLLFTARFISLGRDSMIFHNARIEGVEKYAGTKYNPQISIGEGTSIQQNVHITCADSISIGSYCAITHNVTITDIDHSYEYPPLNYPPPINNPLIVNKVSIGSRCMIFANSIILGGTTIGDNCVVAANSVLRGKFPANCVIAGSPAKIVKRYNPSSDKWEKTTSDGDFIKK